MGLLLFAIQDNHWTLEAVDQHLPVKRDIQFQSLLAPKLIQVQVLQDGMVALPVQHIDIVQDDRLSARLVPARGLARRGIHETLVLIPRGTSPNQTKLPAAGSIVLPVFGSAGGR